MIYMNKFELFKKTFAIPLIVFLIFFIAFFFSPILSDSFRFDYSDVAPFLFIVSILSFILLFFSIIKFIRYFKFPSISEAEHYYKELKRVKLLERAQKEKIEKELATKNYELKMKELEERKKKVL